MDFYLTEDMARAALPRLRAAGEVLHLPPAFTDVDRYAPGERDDFAQYMEDWKIQHFSVREVVTPHHREKARRLGYTEFVPPMHLWAWALLVLSASDRVRDHVGRPVVMRNLYRPMPYNEAVAESGGEFDALNRDGEFRGLFDRAGNRHPASGRHHIGLSYGVIQFTQDSGSLGALLALMRERDPETFAEIFGGSADRLVDITTARGPTSAKSPPRGARVQPVDGADLWEEPWTDRFRRAVHHPPFQDAQLDLAGREYLDPMVEFCDQLGLDTDRALTIVVDRAVQMGRSGARRWIMSTVGPITELGMLAGILSAYGFSGVRDFQRAVPGVKVDGEWGPNTHAALCWFERQRADSDPFVVFVPDRELMLDMMVAASSGERWGHRVERLRTATGFQDEPLDLRG